eukprot:00091.XXX_1705_1872_1 [CDS] Oithona nana genome sequencing.
MCREKAAQSACQNCHLNSIFMPHLASVSRCYFQEKDTRGDTPFRLTNWAPFKMHC